MTPNSDAEIPRVALRVNEACAALSISRSKLYTELQSGRLKARKSGARTLIPVASIAAWLNSLPETAKAA
jgi:excisionase family DNA binding protein